VKRDEIKKNYTSADFAKIQMVSGYRFATPSKYDARSGKKCGSINKKRRQINEVDYQKFMMFPVASSGNEENIR